MYHKKPKPQQASRGLLILKKAMSWKLLSAFVVITSIGIMIMGYFFNLVKI
jgi:uncharacterized membrane protein YraQ (UPF0718 family)